MTAKEIDDPSVIFRRYIYIKAKRFEERVAELFGLLGYRTIVDYKRDDMQFDIRLEMAHPALPIYALVECKDLGEPDRIRPLRGWLGSLRPHRRSRTPLSGTGGCGSEP